MRLSRFFWCLVASALFCGVSAVAEEAPETQLEQRVSALEEKNTLPRGIEISGVVEVEAGFEKYDVDAGGDEDTSDLSLATVELGIDMAIADYVKGHVLFLYEDGDDITVDEGYILLAGASATTLYFKFGTFYVPFGNFTSHMISDPLTVDLGEARETAMEVGFESNGFYGAVYGYNGDVDKDGKSSRIDNFGAMVGYILENETFTLDAGVGYVNNLLDADMFADALEEEQDALAEEEALGLRDYVGGLNVHGVMGFGPFTLIGEYMTAVEAPAFNFTSGAEVTVEKGEKPKAWNMEGAYVFTVAEKETTLALAFQRADNTRGLLPERRIMGAVGVGIFDNTNLALEYKNDRFENDDTAHGVTAQLAIAF